LFLISIDLCKIYFLFVYRKSTNSSFALFLFLIQVSNSIKKFIAVILSKIQIKLTDMIRICKFSCQYFIINLCFTTVFYVNNTCNLDLAPIGSNYNKYNSSLKKNVSHTYYINTPLHSYNFAFRNK